MEWRLLLGVLCLIGILHVPGNSATETTSTATSANITEFILNFSINGTFKSSYSNMSDPDTILLKDIITSYIGTIYKTRFTNFIQILIQQFRNGSIVTDSILQFNNNGTHPNITQLKQALVDEVANETFNTTIIKDSINVIEIVTNATGNGTTTASVKEFTINFKILQTFKEVYSNLSAPETIDLITNITSQVSVVYKKHFVNFIRMVIRQFRSGSIVVDGTFEFDKTGTIPSVTDVTTTLRDAVANGTISLQIDSNSISVTDPAASGSPVLAGMLTALWMTLASLMLSAVMHL
ncbi:uncharacterized protein LOC127444891 [Myxocyprinus asiaticus]|uniref:uncharacterized protein LOC127444891 n=1 Tax=Myxocyprinus asiaticus TaxID=70543 RepID=UPI0022217AE2|nr:uncharacterized protein LOC127444891 [Myxocyprinus asiaticus]